MNTAPVSIRTLLRPLTRPMATKAPRQDASAAPSSERAEAAAAGCNREGAGFIQKTCYLQRLRHPRAALSYNKAQGNVGSDRPAILRGSQAADLRAAARARSEEVKVALVLSQLRDGDVLDRDAVVGIGRDHRVPMRIIIGGCQESLEICKDRVIDLDHIRVEMEIRNGFVAEIGREHERIASVGPDRCGRDRRLGCRAGLRAGVGGIAGWLLRGRCNVARGRSVCGRGRGGSWLMIAEGA